MQKMTKKIFTSLVKEKWIAYIFNNKRRKKIKVMYIILNFQLNY